MKSTTIIIAFLFILLGNLASAQELVERDINAKDSVALAQVWQKFVKGLADKDTVMLRKMSLPLIDCSLCEPDSVLGDGFVPADTFIFQAFNLLPGSRLWYVIENRKPRFHTSITPHFQPKNLHLKRGDSLTLYEVWYVTYKPGEFAPGHEGQSHCFQFVRVNGELKFYGLTSIP